MSQMFQFAASSPNGHQGIGDFQVLYWRGSNYLALADDTNTYWTGGGTPGKSGSVSNSQCRLDLGSSSGTGSGDLFTLSLAITFLQSSTSMQGVYMWTAEANTGYSSGWQQMGSWTPTTPSAPSLSLMSISGMPAAPNAGTVYNVAATWSDMWGSTTVTDLNLLINKLLESAGSCLFHVNSGNGSSQVAIINDAGTAFGPMYNMGSGSISNSYCTLNLAGTNITRSGGLITVTFQLQFTAALIAKAPLRVYVMGADSHGITTWTGPYYSYGRAASHRRGRSSGRGRTW